MRDPFQDCLSDVADRLDECAEQLGLCRRLLANAGGAPAAALRDKLEDLHADVDATSCAARDQVEQLQRRRTLNKLGHK